METSIAKIVETEWWTDAEYRDGMLELPGQSRLETRELAVLDELSSAVEKRALEIAPMPKAAMDAVKLLRSPDADLDDVAQVIQIDAVLTAHVLRRANSALYGARHEIKGMSHAISFIGLRKLKGLILEVAMKQSTSGLRAKGYARAEWRFSLSCALIARSLATLVGADQEICYLSGLLHDIGRLPLIQELADRDMLPATPEAEAPAEIILESLHRWTGEQVAAKWELPPAVCDAARWHLMGREPGEDSVSDYQSTRITETAADLCMALGLGRSRRPFAILKAPSFTDLGLTEDVLIPWFRDVLPGIVAQVDELV